MVKDGFYGIWIIPPIKLKIIIFIIILIIKRQKNAEEQDIYMVTKPLATR